MPRHLSLLLLRARFSSTAPVPTPRFTLTPATATGGVLRRSIGQWTKLAGQLALLAGLLAPALQGCTEIQLATDPEANELADLRANLEEEAVLVQYQMKKKDQAKREGRDADALYDNAAPLRKEQGFLDNWQMAHKKVLEAKKSEYLKRAGKTIQRCTIKARDTNKPVRAEDVDKCVQNPLSSDETIDPILTALLLVGIVLFGIGILVAYRSTRRRLDSVAQAAKKLGLVAVQTTQATEVTGSYKDLALRIEASPPEAGQDDRYLRVIVLSGVHPHTIVRFGPLAPPTGLDLPDLDAPEVHDPRLPEGYKLRLSKGASAEELLSGDLGFQSRLFDPIDIRVHDGRCAVTCWQVPSNPDKVVDFIELAMACAKLYPPD